MNKCIDCGKELKNFYAKRCKSCWYKFMIKENNPNHKHGKSYNNKCIVCGQEIFPESIRCLKCSRKIVSQKLKGIKFTKEHKNKLSESWKNREKVSLETRKKLSLSHGGTGIPYEQRNYHLEFYLFRKLILKRDNYTCQKCFQKGNTVHHIDYNKNNNIEDNLITLCNKCNVQVNFDKNYWREIFWSKLIIIQKEIIPNGKL